MELFSILWASNQYQVKGECNHPFPTFFFFFLFILLSLHLSTPSQSPSVVVDVGGGSGSGEERVQFDSFIRPSVNDADKKEPRYRLSGSGLVSAFIGRRRRRDQKFWPDRSPW